MEKVAEAAHLLKGVHDFTAFTNPTTFKEQPWQNPVKDVEVNVLKSTATMQHHMPFYNDHYENWEFVYSSHSFLYKQVSEFINKIL